MDKWKCPKCEGTELGLIQQNVVLSFIVYTKKAKIEVDFDSPTDVSNHLEQILYCIECDTEFDYDQDRCTITKIYYPDRATGKQIYP